MNLRLYMIGQKYKIFPEMIHMDDNEISVFCDTASKKNPKNLRYRDWFWLHPSAYSLLHFGISVLTILFFGAGAVLALSRRWILPAAILGFIGLFGVYDLIKKINNPLVEGTTFFKQWME